MEKKNRDDGGWFSGGKISPKAINHHHFWSTFHDSVDLPIDIDNSNKIGKKT